MILVNMTDYLSQFKKKSGTKNNSGKGTPRPGEIWMVPNLDNIKDRPVLVIAFAQNMVTFRKCTSQVSTSRPRDLIEDYDLAGLEKETYVDPEIRRTPRNHLAWKIGELSEYDREKFGIIDS